MPSKKQIQNALETFVNNINATEEENIFEHIGTQIAPEYETDNGIFKPFTIYHSVIKSEDGSLYDPDSDYYSNDVEYDSFDVYINNNIREPAYYTELLQVLRKANNYDIVNLYINSPGGNYDTALQLINAIKNSEASIITHIDGLCGSCSAVLACVGDFVVIYPNSQLHFHNIHTSYESVSNNHIVTHTGKTIKHYNELLETHCGRFLTAEEIKRISSEGIELILNAKEINERYSNEIIDYLMNFTETNDCIGLGIGKIWINHVSKQLYSDMEEFFYQFFPRHVIYPIIKSKEA